MAKASKTTQTHIAIKGVDKPKPAPASKALGSLDQKVNQTKYLQGLASGSTPGKEKWAKAELKKMGVTPAPRKQIAQAPEAKTSKTGYFEQDSMKKTSKEYKEWGSKRIGSKEYQDWEDKKTFGSIKAPTGGVRKKK